MNGFCGEIVGSEIFEPGKAEPEKAGSEGVPGSAIGAAAAVGAASRATATASTTARDAAELRIDPRNIGAAGNANAKRRRPDDGT